MSDVPEAIGGYTVVRELGRGAMGVVYLAIQPGLGRQVALKVMAHELSHDPEFLERFRREGEAAAKLRHPNIVQVYDFAQLDGRYVIAMEYLGSMTMKDLLRDKGQQTLETACRMMDELLSALVLAHSKGVVHRDIKPANIMVTDEGPVALTDFSIARMKESSKLTQTGAIVGTPEYMAPEQFDGEWDARSDLYSAGLVFYELLTGLSPFRSATLTEVMRKQLLTVPDPPSMVDFTIPEAVSNVVSQALEKDPANRYASAQDMREALSIALAASLSAQDSPLKKLPVVSVGPQGALPPNSSESTETLPEPHAPGEKVRPAQALSDDLQSSRLKDQEAKAGIPCAFIPTNAQDEVETERGAPAILPSKEPSPAWNLAPLRESASSPDLLGHPEALLAQEPRPTPLAGRPTEGMAYMPPILAPGAAGHPQEDTPKGLVTDPKWRFFAAGIVAVLGFGLVGLGLKDHTPPPSPKPFSSATPVTAAVATPTTTPFVWKSPSEPVLDDTKEDPDSDLWADAPLDERDDPADVPEPKADVQPTYLQKTYIAPGAGIGDVGLGIGKEKVRALWGPPGKGLSKDGVTEWRYGLGKKMADCGVYFNGKNVVEAIYTTSHDFVVAGNPYLKPGATYQGVLANFPQPSEKTDELLNYSSRGVLFMFEQGICRTILVYGRHQQIPDMEFITLLGY